MLGKPVTMRVIVDTNLWISFLIGKTLNGLENAVISNQVNLLFSEELFAELLEVLQRPKFKKYFSSTAIEGLIALLYDHVEWVEITCQYEACRDRKDNFLLDLAVSGKANYLVTGDADLLVLNPFHDTEILTFRDFEDRVLNRLS